MYSDDCPAIRWPMRTTLRTMNGIELLRLLDCVYLVSLALWLGSLCFLAFGTLPLLRRRDTIETERVLWAQCGRWGTVCGAIALPALVCGTLAVTELRGPRVGLAATLILAALLGTLYIAAVLAPRLGTSSTTEADPRLQARLRNRIQTINSMVMVLIIASLVLHAYRPTPSTQGIQEPDPATRYRQSQMQLRSKNQEMWSRYFQDQPKPGANPRENSSEPAKPTTSPPP